MEFQFPANPSVGDTVTNPLTGTTYVWSDKGRWKVNNVASQNVSIFEGDTLLRLHLSTGCGLTRLMKLLNTFIVTINRTAIGLLQRSVEAVMKPLLRQ